MKKWNIIVSRKFGLFWHNQSISISDWWAFAQAASCFGFFGILVSFFLVILYLFVGSCKGNGEVATGAAILCLLTGNSVWLAKVLLIPQHRSAQSS